MNLMLPLAGLAAGTFAFRLAGPLLRSRTSISPRIERLASIAVAVVFVALIATALVVDNGFAGFACLTGILVAAVLAWKNAPFVVIVVAAAATTAGLRFFGVA
ncbi:AzlD domain-containing protein [Rhodococcus sp. P1Y]|uniref:AzlD domain-containing protein n=1 Tax=Rhodococcus sp. P1Y TaxID=1302308 RepID=UPI000EAF1B85|nr:AzlD domain-containing protein [Rhodococcus sp. P1Y]AYJ47487.1 AzlD domain-containing protein [Rhodococcus sp. P1Y]